MTYFISSGLLHTLRSYKYIWTQSSVGDRNRLICRLSSVGAIPSVQHISRWWSGDRGQSTRHGLRRDRSLVRRRRPSSSSWLSVPLPLFVQRPKPRSWRDAEGAILSAWSRLTGACQPHVGEMQKLDRRTDGQTDGLAATGRAATWRRSGALFSIPTL